MKLRSLISETVDDLVKAHTECAEAGIPLPDKELKNLRKTHTGWAYDKPKGHTVEHNTTPDGERGHAYIRHLGENGMVHRTDGPAIIWADGSKAWMGNGVETGSKYVMPNGHEEHWWGNRKLDKSTFKRYFKGVD